MPAEPVRPRNLLLYDPEASEPSWNARMSPGEFAILYSHTLPTPEIPPGQQYCTIYPSLESAEAHASSLVATHPGLRCRIYDHHGLGAQPIREISGKTHKAAGEISPRFRRWAGSILFFGGLALAAFDWQANFRYGWPSMIGTRLFPTGLVLLAIEAGYLLNAAQKRHTPNDRP